MQFVEFDPERHWWGDRYDPSSYTMRKEGEFAWKVDFQAEKKDALARAQPHYVRADEYEKLKQEKNAEIKRLNALTRKLYKESGDKKINKEVEELEAAIKYLKQEVFELEHKIKEAVNEGDRIKYSIYNLDRLNPHLQKDRILDPDKLLSELKQLQGKITDTQQNLINELTKILSQDTE